MLPDGNAMSDGFDRRRRSFEAEYFSRKSTELVSGLKMVFSRKIDKENIRRLTGITDERLLDNLVLLNVSGDLLTAFNLLPLVELAWADGGVDDREVRALLQAMDEAGVVRDSDAHRRLEFAVRTGPNPEAKKVWYHYAEELKKVLPPRELAEFREDLLANARSIAAVSGGILNVAFTVSPNEKAVLREIEKALTVG
jgi:tellurite resistance protein